MNQLLHGWLYCPDLFSLLQLGGSQITLSLSLSVYARQVYLRHPGQNIDDVVVIVLSRHLSEILRPFDRSSDSLCAQI